jgi:hypothetical protein
VHALRIQTRTFSLPSLTPYPLQRSVQIINVQRQMPVPTSKGRNGAELQSANSLILKELNLLPARRPIAVRTSASIAPVPSHRNSPLMFDVRAREPPKRSTQNFSASCKDRTTKAVSVQLHMTNTSSNRLLSLASGTFQRPSTMG